MKSRILAPTTPERSPVERRVRRLANQEMNIEHAKCCACGKERSGISQWWYLSGYYGLSGFVCGGCFEKVSHRDGKPKHPVSYRIILKKLS